MLKNTPISVTYTDTQLHILVEEFITMQRKEFTFRGVRDFVLYRAIEEGRTAGQTLYESNELQPSDQERIRCVLTKIADEGRFAATADNLQFVKVKE